MAKILVVDDHPINRQFLVKLLGYVNHTVREAADGSQALAMVEADRPDLVISDIVMPNMDGPTFIKEMRKQPGLAETPVIFYTASYRVPDAKELARDCNVSRVMHKPARPEDILAAVNAALRSTDPSPHSPSSLLDAETLRLAALTELGLDLIKETDPLRLLRRFLQSVRYILGSSGTGAVVTDSRVPSGGYAALLHNSSDLIGPTDPRVAAELIGKLVNWQPMARLVNPALDPAILGLPGPIYTLSAAAIPFPDHKVAAGWLFVFDKAGRAEFSREDERMIVMLANQLAITFENAQLHADAKLRAMELQKEIVERKQVEEALRERARYVALSAGVGLALTGTESLRDMLQLCTESIVQNLDAAFARIWTLNEAESTLELQASAGMYTHLDGPHGRVPVGSLIVGLVAQERKPHLTDDVANDPRVSDKEWVKREGMVAFAGYPLLVGDRLVGVMAMFARQPLPLILDALGSVANQIALGIHHKQTEAERVKLTARLRMQVDRMPLGYLLLDADYRIVDWNGKAEGIFGYLKDEMVGQGFPFEKILPRAGRPAAAKTLRRLRAGDMAANMVNENRTKDGRTITCHWTNSPLFDSDGAFLGVISLAEDITEQMHLKEQVQEAQQRLEHVIASSPAVLYTLAVDGSNLYPTWISGNVQEMMGYSPEETRQANWWQEHVHPEDFERAQNEIQQEFFPKGRLAHEHRFRHKDGTYHWVRSEMRLLRDAAGKPIEAVGSWSDITERKLLEEQYRQAQKMEAVGRLAGGIAHDFNNLLTVIMGYSDVYLAKLRPEDPLRMPLTEIRKAGERATGLTRQLLAFSRKQVLMPVVLSLNTVIGSMEKMLGRLIGEDVALTVLAGPDLWEVKADPGQMEQVIMNIIVNARDAMPEGGNLLLETKNVEIDPGYAANHGDVKAGEHVLLAISDTGCGMDASVKARIFEPFFTTKGPNKGTGLGLATVFGIVKQSGGHIEVYSEVGQGTTFKIYLPRDKSGAPAATSPRTKEPVRGGKELILLVEDEAGVRVLAKAVLQFYGYTVLDAPNGGDALLICETHARPIDLMITDVVMPNFSGRQLAERLALRQPFMRVLFMSGYTDDAIVHHGVLESGTPFLQKPFAPEALARKVREVLDAAPKEAG